MDANSSQENAFLVRCMCFTRKTGLREIASYKEHFLYISVKTLFNLNVIVLEVAVEILKLCSVGRIVKFQL